MKRFIMVILAVLAFCTLVACGADKAEDDKASDPDSDITSSSDEENLPPNGDSIVTSVSDEEEPVVTSTPEAVDEAETATESQVTSEAATTTAAESTSAATTTEATTSATTVTTTSKPTTTTAKTESTSISVDDEFADFPIVEAEDDTDNDSSSEDIGWENVNLDEILADLEDEGVKIDG